VGRALLSDPAVAEQVIRLLVADDVFELADAATRSPLDQSMGIATSHVDQIERVRIAPLAGPPSTQFSFHADRIQAWEVQQTHGDWLSANVPG
jgi:hypothetical protein